MTKFFNIIIISSNNNPSKQGSFFIMKHIRIKGWGWARHCRDEKIG